MIDYIPPTEGVMEKWLQYRGDSTLRLDYPLGPDSVVVDAGGYVGQWAYDINNKYNSIVFVLEPLPNLHMEINRRFAQNPKVIPLNYAIAKETGEAQMSDNTNCSSMYDNMVGATQNIMCKDVKDFIVENNIDNIDLLKINIEGAEYDLLERIIELGLLPKIKNLQIQFHRFIPDCQARRSSILANLSKTHECTWNFEWVWENWKLKD